uniref:Peptidase S1 domain-containing protein n=1 Tax=Romanomermis culicivorax TaxID=13658 RepID=A0A915JMG1_ROMCU
MRRVFNGEEVVLHSKPWMGLLRQNSTVLCSSFLISRQYGLAGNNYDKSSDIALTAAHCVYDESRQYTILMKFTYCSMTINFFHYS